MKSITFPITGLNIKTAGLYNYTFNTLEELQEFYWNSTKEQSEEIEEIFWKDKTSVLQLVNFPHFYKIIQSQAPVVYLLDGNECTQDEFIEINKKDPNVHQVSDRDLKRVISLKVGEKIFIESYPIERIK